MLLPFIVDQARQAASLNDEPTNHMPHASLFSLLTPHSFPLVDEPFAHRLPSAPVPIDPQKLTIVHYPASVLRGKAKALTQINDEVRAVAVRMLVLMHEAPGVGLAAPQVGLPWRLFVANPTGQPEDDLVFINPVLSNPSREVSDYEEGCLSLPDIRATIRRPKGITVTALDLAGKTFTLSSDELAARVWQHETDHLDGVLILDRMTELDRRACRKAIKGLEESGAK